jgi:3'-5' exoribonuclease
VAAIAELHENHVVEGTYAVARKQTLRTRAGAPYLALELVDPSGRIDARVWTDVDLLDARFQEGDAIKVLGRVERFQDRLQLDVRALEASDADPEAFSPRLSRDLEELDGFLDFLVGEVHHPGFLGVLGRCFEDRELRIGLRTLPATPDGHHSYAGGLIEHTVGVATICRELTQLHQRLRADLLLAAALLHDLGRIAELGRGPAFRPSREGELLGHVQLGLHLIDDRAPGLEPLARAELLHAVTAHHDVRRARTAEAAALYHANQLDAVAATRPAS